ncbi:MAG: ATPase, partial [Desulfuromonadales bacterium]|nr:ATPase [Desulfuromonadales bacterium]NIS42203.1 ATPase [Desulfuromonadales bacterium]
MKYGKQIRTLSLTLLLLIAVSSVALAAGGGGHADSGALLKDFFWRTLNFAIMAGILIYFVAKPAKNALKGRTETIARELEEAKTA